MKHTMSYDSSTENAALLAAGAALADPVTISEGAKPFVTVPDGFKVRDIEDLLVAPVRKRGSVALLDSVSFSQYLSKHLQHDGTVLYANVDFDLSKCDIVAIINDHKAYAPQWRDHLALYSPKLSREWRTWLGHDRKMFTQSEFATFIEDNLPDLASQPGLPTAGEMLQMALSFEANHTKTFKKTIDLQAGGVALEFVDKADTETTTKMDLFKRFAIGIPVFDATHASAATEVGYPIESRLKFRQKDTGLVFWYELIRPDRVFRQAVNDEFESITLATGLSILRGTPGLAASR